MLYDYQIKTVYSIPCLVSMPIGTITHPDDSVAVKLAIKETSVKGVFSHSGEYRIICKNGQQKWIYLVANKYFNTQGLFENIMVECIDITGRKEAEARMVADANRNYQF